MGTWYGALCLPCNLCDLPNNNYLKILPKFNGEKGVVVEDHVGTYVYFMDDMNIDYEYVYTHVFFSKPRK